MSNKINLNVLAALAGCLLCIFMWCAGEAALWAIEKINPAPAVEPPTYPSNFFKQDEFGIFEATPGNHRCFHKGSDGHMLYDRTYAIDEYGRRITPVDSSNRDQFIAFVGCSFTFGEGVADDETLPFYVGQAAKRHVPYNYGMMGLSSYDVLAKIENIDFQKEMKEPRGIFIYLFMADHLNRIMGSMEVMGWDFNGCYYHPSSTGQLVRKGDYRTGRPVITRFYKLLSKSRILRALNIDLPVRTGDVDLKRVAQAARAMDTAVKQKYPGSEFYVVIYPGPHPDRLAGYIEAQGVKVLDYTKLFGHADPPYYLTKEDQHPSPLAYRTLAERIVKDLQLDTVR